jgi:hypothetical protein
MCREVTLDVSVWGMLVSETVSRFIWRPVQSGIVPQPELGKSKGVEPF